MGIRISWLGSGNSTGFFLAGLVLAAVVLGGGCGSGDEGDGKKVGGKEEEGRTELETGSPDTGEDPSEADDVGGVPRLPLNSGAGEVGLGGSTRSGWMAGKALEEWTEVLWNREIQRSSPWAPGVLSLEGGEGEALLILTAWDHHLEARSIRTGELRWRSLLPGMAVHRPVEVGGDLLVLTHNGYLTAVDPDGGTVVLRYRGKEPVQSGMVTDGERLFFAAAGDLTALDAEDGEVLWTRSVEGRQRLSVNRGVLAAAGSTALVLRDTVEGGELFHWEEGAGMPVPPILMNGRVFAALAGGDLVCLDDDTGRLIWRSEGSSEVVQTVLTEQLMAAADRSGQVRAISRTEGRTVWERSFPGGLGGFSAVPGAFYVAGSQGELHTVRPRDGEDLWMDDTGVPLRGAPLPWGEGVLLSGETGGGEGRLMFYSPPLPEVEKKDGEGEAAPGETDAGGAAGKEEGLPILKPDGKVREYRMSGSTQRMRVKLEKSGTFNVYSPSIEETPLRMILLDEDGVELESNFAHSGIDGGFVYNYDKGESYTLLIEAPGGTGKETEYTLVMMPAGRS